MNTDFSSIDDIQYSMHVHRPCIHTVMHLFLREKAYIFYQTRILIRVRDGAKYTVRRISKH